MEEENPNQDSLENLHMNQKNKLQKYGENLENEFDEYIYIDLDDHHQRDLEEISINFDDDGELEQKDHEKSCQEEPQILNDEWQIDLEDHKIDSAHFIQEQEQICDKAERMEEVQSCQKKLNKKNKAHSLLNELLESKPYKPFVNADIKQQMYVSINYKLNVTNVYKQFDNFLI